MKLLTTKSMTVLLLAFGSWASIQMFPLQAQNTPNAEGGELTNRCQQMKAMHQQMQAEVKAQDQELTQLVTQMNSAPADQKLEAVVAVVNKLAEQRLAMHQRVETMHSRMHQHMMQHMQGGTNSMAQCPMMKDMTEDSTQGGSGSQGGTSKGSRSSQGKGN